MTHPDSHYSRGMIAAGFPQQPSLENGEQELLKAIHQGNPDAFWCLWLKFSDKLFDRCLRWTKGNYTEAEDVHADCMIKARERVQQYAGKIRNAEAWFIRLVNNHCIDIYRQRKNLVSVGEDTHFRDTFCTSKLAPDERLINGQHVSSLIRFASGLGSDLKTPFFLHFIYGQTYAEIANKCGISQVNVRKRIQLARKSLRQKLSQWETGKATPEESSPLNTLLDVSQTASVPDSFSVKPCCVLKVIPMRFENGLVLNAHIYISKTSAFASTIAQLENYVRKHPRGWKKHLELARAYELAGEGSKALEHYGILSQKRPTNPSIVWRFTQLLEISGQLDDAANILQNMANKIGEIGLAYFGRSLALQGNWVKAEQVLHRAANQFPKDSFSKYLLSFFLFQIDRFDEALHHLNVLLASEPNHLPASSLRLEIHRLQGEQASFLDHLLQHLQIHPNHPLAIKRGVDTSLNNGTFSEYWYALLEKLTPLASHSSFYLESWCLYHQVLGNNHKAQKLLESFVKMHPGEPGGWYRLARWYFQQKRIDQALSALARGNALSIRIGHQENKSLPQHQNELEIALNQSPLLPRCAVFI